MSKSSPFLSPESDNADEKNVQPCDVAKSAPAVPACTRLSESVSKSLEICTFHTEFFGRSDLSHLFAAPTESSAPTDKEEDWFTVIDTLIDPPSLSPSIQGSFAYKTVKDRLPDILTSIIDTLSRSRGALIKQFGNDLHDDLHMVMHEIQKLRYQLQTDKPLDIITDDLPDAKIWNSFLAKILSSGAKCSYFNLSWLYVECYVYRRVKQAFQNSKNLKQMDPFQEGKCEQLESNKTAVEELLIFANSTFDHILENKHSDAQTKWDLYVFLEVALWANRCDLSISAGKQQNVGSHKVLESLLENSSNLLLNDFDPIFRYLTCKKTMERIDIILDNSGFELVADLCLAEFLLAAGFTEKVHLHGKIFPWFVSDVTRTDFDWLIRNLENKATTNSVQKFVKKITKHLEDEAMVYDSHEFWTLPFDYSCLRKFAPDLYRDLSTSGLLIFKGDLNYRKLVGDLKWPMETKFKRALRGFLPTSIVSLRTLKADVVVGMSKSFSSEEMEDDWMVCGKYGIIQACLL